MPGIVLAHSRLMHGKNSPKGKMKKRRDSRKGERAASAHRECLSSVEKTLAKHCTGCKIIAQDATWLAIPSPKNEPPCGGRVRYFALALRK